MSSYVPGERIKEVIDEMKPSEAANAAFERGFYDGQYEVATTSHGFLPPDLERIRAAAQKLWQRKLVTLEEIMNWVADGAMDPIQQEPTLPIPPDDVQGTTVLLINNDVFKRHW